MIKPNKAARKESKCRGRKEKGRLEFMQQKVKEYLYECKALVKNVDIGAGEFALAQSGGDPAR